MNPDDFEKQLQHQPLRQPPAAWREEILTIARANISKSASARESELLAGWRVWLARFPVAWGAVAALWLVIIGANSLVSGPSIAVSASAPAPRATLATWSLQRAQVNLLANGFGDFPDLAPPRETPSAPPRPRSERRRDDGLGETATPSNLSAFA